MFNEILTGKASNQPPPEPISPYRENVVPPIRHMCISCSESYDAPAGSEPDRCPTCRLAMAELNRRESDHVFQAAQVQRARAERSHRILYGIIMVAAIIAVGFARYAMHAQMREDAAAGAGYHSYADYKTERDMVYATDDYSIRIHELAGDMCACKDLACARNVQTQFVRFARTGSPGDDMARKSVDQDTVRLGECQATFEGN